MLVFSIIAYSVTLFFVKSDLKKTEEKKAEQLMANIDGAIAQSNAVANFLSLDDVIIKYSQEDGTEKIETITEVNRMLKSYRIFPHTTRQAILNPYNNHAVTDGGTTMLSQYSVQFGLNTDSFSEKVLNMSSSNINSIELIGVSNGGVNYIICLLSRETAAERPVIFSFIYDISSFFSSISKSSIPTTFFIEAEQNNLTISYDNEENHLISFSDTSGISSLKEVAAYEGYSTYMGKIRCGVYSPLHKYLFRINNFFLLLILFIAAFLMLSHLVVKNNANFLYKPVKNALALLPKNMIDDTGEFNAFEKYISALSDQRDVMAEIISDNKIQLSDKFLFKVLTSTLSNIEIKEGVSAYGFDKIKFPVVTFIVSYRNFSALKDVLSNEGLNEVRLSINDYFYDIFKGYDFFKLIDIDQQNIAGIVSTDNAESFAKQIKTAALGIEMLMDVDFSVFIGKTADSWYEISESYSSASEIKDKYWVIPNQNIVISANTNDNEKYSQIIYYSSSLEDEIINNVLSGNKEIAVNQLNKIIDTNMDGKALTREHYAQLVIMLYSTFTKLFTIINKTEKDIFDSVRIYLELMSCQDSQSLKIKTSEFITTIISNIATTKETEFENEKELILSYIHNNYKNDITLFTLAEHLNISQIYASKKFKQCVGESFKDYLTNYRLDIAMEMMKNNPNENLSIIAKSVGFSSRTFTRAFTQKYGMTPSNCIQKFK